MIFSHNFSSHNVKSRARDSLLSYNGGENLRHPVLPGQHIQEVGHHGQAWEEDHSP